MFNLYSLIEILEILINRSFHYHRQSDVQLQDAANQSTRSRNVAKKEIRQTIIIRIKNW